MTFIPHSTQDDEARFIVILSNLVAKGDVPSLPKWNDSINDEKARLIRKKQGEKEAAEAEALAKELGVWDEFYGSGKTGHRKGKAKAKSKANEEEDDTSALQALILKKKQTRETFFDDLAAKYAQPEKSSKGKGKRKGLHDSDDTDSPKKKSKATVPPPPDIDDEEFARIQSRMFGDKGKTEPEGRDRKRRGTKTK